MTIQTTRMSSQQLIGSTFSFQHWPFESVIGFLANEGMKEVEIWGIAPHLDVFDTDKKRLDHVKRILNHHDMTLRCYTPEQIMYPMNIASGDARLRTESIQRFMRAVDICAELDGRYVLVTAGRGYETATADKAWQHAIEGLSLISAHAARSGVRILLEPLQRSESNILHTARDVHLMLNEVNADNLDVILDLVGMSAANDSVEDYLMLFGERLAHVHVVDGTPAGHLVWGEGNLPLGDFLTALAKGGYSGPLSFEPFGTGGYAMNPEQAWHTNVERISPYLTVNKGVA